MLQETPLEQPHWQDDPEGGHPERHFVLKGQEEFDRLLHFALLGENFSGHKVAGDFFVAFKVDFACWLSYPEVGSPIWNNPGKNNARIAIGVYDRADLHLVHGLNINVTVLDSRGGVVGAKEHPFLYRPHHNLYGANWQLPGDGKYTLRIRIEATPGMGYTSPVTVDFHDVEICTGHMVS